MNVILHPKLFLSHESTNLQVFTFLLKLNGVPLFLSWGILCATYIYFKRAINDDNAAAVKQAQSPFQPYLAYWGLFWSVMVGMELQSRQN